MSRKNILKNYNKQLIIDTYAEHKTLEKTAIIFGVHLETLRKYFINNKIEYALRRKYQCDHEFFSRDDEKCFYWAGFIAADGNIEKDGNRLKIELAIKDIEHLDKWKADVKSTAPIVVCEKVDDRPEFIQDSYITCKIRLNSAQIVKDLKRFNIVPAKSLIYNIPDWLMIHSLFNHFLRGLIDGDGSSAIDGGASRINLCGSAICMQKLHDHFHNQLGCLQFKIRKDGLGLMCCTNLKDNTKIINFLWKDATIWLDRKHKIQSQILQIIPRKLDIKKEILEEMLKETPLIKGSLTKIYLNMANQLGCSPSAIKRRLVEFNLYHPH